MTLLTQTEITAKLRALAPRVRANAEANPPPKTPVPIPASAVKATNQPVQAHHGQP